MIELRCGKTARSSKTVRWQEPLRSRGGRGPRLILAVAVLVLVGTACGDESAPTEPEGPERVSVTGTVMAAGSGVAVDEATVIGTQGESGAELFQATTDSEGNYAADFDAASSPNQVVVRAEAEGYQAAERSLAFGSDLQVDLELHAVAASMSVVERPTSLEVGTRVQVTFVVTNVREDPVAGAQVTFHAPEGSGVLEPEQAETGGDGTATAQWTLGTQAGIQELEATLDTISETLSVEALPGPASALEEVAGDAQVRRSGAELPGPLVVALSDEYGNPIPDESVRFRVVGGGGTLSATFQGEAHVQTNEDGLAQTSWTLGSEGGEQEVEASHDGLPPVRFTAQALDFQLALAGPEESERFLTGEPIFLQLQVDGDPVPVDSIRWFSDVDGELGSGAAVSADALSSTTHQLEARVLGASEGVEVRVFDDLWDLYRSEPAPSEVDRILEDFDIVYVDGDAPDEKWDQYGFDFNPETNAPSKLVIVSQLEVLRRQRFEERPTFIGDYETVYDWVRSRSPRIRIDLGRCGGASGGGGGMTLSRTHAHYGLWFGGDTCDTGDQAEFSMYSLGIIMHEARHSEPDDPRHMTCDDGWPGDRTLQDGSGYAWSAKYAMWVYRYSKHDPPLVREVGYSWIGQSMRDRARNQLRRICEDRSHTDPRVQAIVDEIMEDG